MKVSIALFQPDIPGNTGAILRLGACLQIDIHIIEPAGFDISNKNLRRAGMDYLELAQLHKHLSWEHFYDYAKTKQKRILLFTTKATRSYYEIDYSPADILLFGRESAGAPDYIHKLCDEKLHIPMQKSARSLNLALSVAMAASQACKP
ncbi:tRNA (cytidine(34)-2'-O)-methyltransferase [Bartonella sp. TP]|uniref:tRNA (cytidine(34)-2'-O)-methyltransferase n=1 Tax=Bartonella sp. TP TaxID=3057550 RepID=UPI0025B185D1|nr:tRNA (cytidine(34)-2'-O)-methyltransferase [Bartonella sp. TP]MDN5249739.1 tRNA (cytidine(34)-2'-O)-methyltransferase [Alphaproteobacteria bacterium]WJW79714.1 tRNA (cytidine(34)-2'-O)-methyltransferase [Bartonella sp. TP]